MDEFKPNSFKSKEQKDKPPEKRVEKADIGGVKMKKKSDLRRFADLFVPKDITTTKDVLLEEVLAPSIKRMIANFFKTAIDMLLNGGEEKKKSGSAIEKISYRKFYDEDAVDRKYRTAAPRITNPEDILFESREDAELIVNQLDAVIEQYDFASVFDFCDLVGIDTNPADANYGWTSVKNARVVRRRDGYVIDMPKRIPLDRR